ncbi:amidophosphoribosyltransferase [Candidatus Oleimmundimicrobium sp.]|uniref:amidophosphoribosyltransferase n=1 Tax=Candidatus Oleimmundimicrobium sp. TaxID=3060597 RepID=UPI002717A988|nr:amidophosphoribosyltransferase [Candidatus Oleimmundimicrobium sp.]MDO8885613.1 amidophosphoribosyltransferase [Candidatus Oleimmundimicrobium sp.]
MDKKCSGGCKFDCFTPDRFEEACGVFGIYAPETDVARLTYFGLYALQHRGQESAGIAVSDGTNVLVFKDMGLVPQVFNEQILSTLTGKIAIGHTRYSTTGSNRWENAQPIHKTYHDGTLALAHNGNLVNSRELRKMLTSNGNKFRSTSDSEIIAGLIANFSKESIEDGIKKTMELLKGGYSVTVVTEDKLIGFRDPYGIRPLSLGKLEGNYVISSETCGFDIVGAEFLRDIEPGEIVVIDEEGLHSEKIISKTHPSLCIFEFVYFARPDSLLYGKLLHNARNEMGKKLAKECPAEADLVIPVPDSGISAAVGYAQSSGIPFGEGMIKNRYVGRTFIQPAQSSRQIGVKMKLNPLKEIIKGKRLVVVDDSIVRGTTSKQIVSMLRDAGAKEIHMRISSPPIEWPCFYGIDTAKRNELVAFSKSVDEIKDFVGADTLGYLSLEGLVSSTGKPRDLFCTACFDGIYPIEIPEEYKLNKQMLETPVKYK